MRGVRSERRGGARGGAEGTEERMGEVGDSFVGVPGTDFGMSLSLLERRAGRGTFCGFV